MKHINFEDGAPLFTEGEMADAIDLVSTCIVAGVKQGTINDGDWHEYLLKRNNSLLFPEEMLNFIKLCIVKSIKTLTTHE
jgi:hypothetical protein